MMCYKNTEVVMLKILFSPSEAKNSGGKQQKQKLFGAGGARDEILHAYNTIINTQNEQLITKLFGLKKFEECEPYLCDIFTAPLLPAIERYSGVAYDYLNYHELNLEAQSYLQQNTLIFSNLYGPVLGGDTIANYKVKQGNSIGNIAPEKFYKERFSYQLDLFFAECEILDLRAGYYEKFYKPNKSVTTLKFLKNGKTVSHWAKAYRGIVLREIAKNNIRSIKEFMAMPIEGLSLQEIKKTKNKTEIIYNL